MDLEGRNLALGFVEQYVSHLLPALERIEGECTEQSKLRREHVIRYEADMALAMSAKGFTWSSALRSKLEKEKDLAIRKPAHILQFENPEIEGNVIFSLFPQSKVKLNTNYSSTAQDKCCKYYSDPSIVEGNLGEVVCDQVCLKKRKKHLSKGVHDAKYKRRRPKLLVKRLRIARKIKQKRSVQSRIETLRKLTPGGNGMDTDVLFKELGNYITCLQIQVKVLHHLTEFSARK